MEYAPITSDEFAELDGLDDWRFALGAIHGSFAAGSYPAAAEFVAAIADAAERLDHHPDIDVRYPGTVSVTVTTHAAGGLTTLDVDLAREISRLAAAGIPAGGPPIQVTELCIDTMDETVIRPFWAAVLDYDVVESDGSLVDPRRQGWSIWFQQMDEPRTDRNRFHLDVSVPHDLADERIAAALAAGGRMVNDARARAFWILADAEGNEACICTWQDRN